MRLQSEYTEVDRVYAEWVTARDKINAIDYGQACEDWDGQRTELVMGMEDAASRYRNLTGRSPA